MAVSLVTMERRAAEQEADDGLDSDSDAAFEQAQRAAQSAAASARSERSGRLRKPSLAGAQHQATLALTSAAAFQQVSLREAAQLAAAAAAEDAAKAGGEEWGADGNRCSCACVVRQLQISCKDNGAGQKR
jgi:hypothetical protein